MTNQQGQGLFFLGGTGRCGTNILTKVLAQHPDVAALPFEHRIFLDPDGIVDFYQSYASTWTPYLADSKLRRLENLLKALGSESSLHRSIGDVIKKFDKKGLTFTPRSYHGWGLEEAIPGYGNFVEELMRDLREFSYRGAWVGSRSYTYKAQIQYASSMSREELATTLGRFSGKVFSSLMKRFGKPIFVDDNTFNTLMSRELLTFMPEAKIIHIYRDPRDVVASMTKQRFTPSDHTQAATYYRDCMGTWLAAKKELDSTAYVEVSLEELVGDTKTTCENLCQFMGMDIDPAMLEIDLSRSHSGRWKTDFSPAQQRDLETILGEQIQTLGYS